MARRLPNLNALKAFEAAARHLSFTRAAAELNVTQGAVSHQVQALEAQLGHRLFKRLNRRLELTPAGRDYLPSVSEAFDRIAEATGRLDRDRSGGPLKLSTMPSFATKWLLPRLPALRRAVPDLEVMISATPERVDVTGDAFDVAIRFGAGRYPELHETFLMDDAVLPVCAPSLLRQQPGGPPPLRRPDGCSSSMRPPCCMPSAAPAHKPPDCGSFCATPPTPSSCTPRTRHPAVWPRPTWREAVLPARARFWKARRAWPRACRATPIRRA